MTIFGFFIPTWLFWGVIGILVVGVIGFILKGFISEMRKK